MTAVSPDSLWADSGIDTGRPARASRLDLVGRPALDLRPEPELDTPFAEVDDRAWHIHVPTLVQAYAVPMREADDLGDALGID